MEKQRSVVTASAAAAAAAVVLLLFAFPISVTAGAKDNSMGSGVASGWAAAAASAREIVRARLERRQRFPDPPRIPSNNNNNNNNNERPKIITKHHFMRERKSSLVPIPKPFVVSTELNVRLPDHTGRRGRTWKQHDGSTVVEGEDRLYSSNIGRASFGQSQFIQRCSAVGCCDSAC